MQYPAARVTQPRKPHTSDNSAAAGTRQRGGTQLTGGVLDFTAATGTVSLPVWMLGALDVPEGRHVYLRVADDLPRADSVVLQPVDGAFGDLRDHKAVLELALSGHYSTLTEATVVPINHLGRPYAIRVLEVHPSPSASLFDTEVEVGLGLRRTGAHGQAGLCGPELRLCKFCQAVTASQPKLPLRLRLHLRLPASLLCSHCHATG